MMVVYLWGLVLFLFLTIMAGFVRVWRGPTPGDRMLAVQLFTTTTLAILLLLGKIMSEPALNDVALVLVLVAAVATVAFVRRVRHTEEGEAV